MSSKPSGRSLARLEVPCVGELVYAMVYWIVLWFVTIACTLLVVNWQFVDVWVALFAVVILVYVGVGYVRAIFFELGPRRFFLRFLARFARRCFVEVFQDESGDVYVGFSFDVLCLHLVELEIRDSEITRLKCEPSQEMDRGYSDDSWRVVLRYSSLPEAERKGSAARRHDYYVVGSAQRRQEAQQLAGRIASLLQSTGVDIRVGD